MSYIMDEETKKEFQEFLKQKARNESLRQFFSRSQPRKPEDGNAYTFDSLVMAHHFGFEDGIKYAIKED